MSQVQELGLYLQTVEAWAKEATTATKKFSHMGKEREQPFGLDFQRFIERAEMLSSGGTRKSGLGVIILC